MLSRVLLASLVFAPALALAQTPPEGVPLEVERGFFTETDVGAFLTLGGEDGYSNLQTYLQLGVGYNLSESIELGFNVGIGSSAANCFSVRVGNACLDDAGAEIADNFTMTFINVTGAYLFRLADRLYLAPKITGGYTVLGPAPIRDVDGQDVTSGPNVGGGLGLEYATHMSHFSIGIDATARYTLGPNIVGLAVFPRVKYTF